MAQSEAFLHARRSYRHASADDILILTRSCDELHNMVSTLMTELEVAGLTLNIKKNKILTSAGRVSDGSKETNPDSDHVMNLTETMYKRW